MVETLFIYPFIYLFIYLVSDSVLTYADVFMLRACKLQDHNQEGIKSLHAAYKQLLDHIRI